MGIMGYMTALVVNLENREYDYLAEAGYELAALNFLAGGVITGNSQDVRPDAGAETFGEVGLRGVFGPMLSDLVWDVPEDEQFDRARTFIDEYHDTYDGRIRATINSHDDWSCTRQLWERTADLAEEYPDLLVHTHLLELEESNTMARSNGAKDSIALLNDVGLLDDRLVAAHFRLADDEDIHGLEREWVITSRPNHCTARECSRDGSRRFRDEPRTSSGLSEKRAERDCELDRKCSLRCACPV
nr:amidohydrolase family protein [Natrinema pallidum]